MNLRPGRLPFRTAALTTVLGLAAGSLLAAPAAGAAEPSDSDVALAGGAWLTRQLDGGVVVNDQFDFTDYGLTLDVGLALDAFDGSRYDAPLRTMTRAVTTPAAVRAYTTGRDFGDAGSRYAGATAKLAAFVQQRGRDAGRVGGTDLVSQLEGLAADSGPAAGRVSDRSEFGDNANVLGQSFAARALTVAGSTEAGDVTTYLLDQQCSAGFFRSSFSGPDAADQTCDGADRDQRTPDVDATALALINLQATDPATGSPADTAIEDGVAWLLGVQARSGSFSAAPPAGAVPNTNSTGLAAQALAGAGEDDAATRAATWVEGLQASACDGRLARQSGAVAYDRPAYTLARREGITTSSRDQWRRASAQATPALRSVPDRVGTVTLRGPAARYVRAGSEVTLRVRGLDAREEACVAGPAGGTRTTGPGPVAVRVPAGTATRTYRVEDTDAVVSVRALAAKRLAPRLAKRAVARGGTQTVTVRGLAAGERVTVRLRGRAVDSGVATARGFFRSTFRVSGTRGRAPVSVTGQFGTRTGTKAFQVR